MTFKEELMAAYTEAQVNGLKNSIQVAANNGARSLKLPLTKIDFKRRYLFHYELVGHGKVMWDELVKLGFTPSFTFGGDWGGGPGLWIEW
jgi:hypothetical protein